MTLCGMEVAHKFLAYKNAMNATYKLENHITAAHFARQVLDLEPTGVRSLPSFFRRYSPKNPMLLPNSRSTTKLSSRRARTSTL